MARVNGSGEWLGWHEEEGGTSVILPPAFSLGWCYKPRLALFVWLISHQPTVLFSQNKPATGNQPTVLFSQNKSAPAINHQPNEQAVKGYPLVSARNTSRD
jgi:hypothetical protein